MTAQDGTQAGGGGEVSYPYAGSACLGWTVFCTVVAVLCIALALLADVTFLGGVVGAPLFGGVGAALFGGMALSWGRLWRHRGPALVLGEDGITADSKLGGPFVPAIEGVVRWDEITSVSTGSHGAVVLDLADPEAFWARQPALARALAWHPARPGREWLALAASDLARRDDVAAAIRERVDRARLERRADPGLPPALEPDRGDA